MYSMKTLKAFRLSEEACSKLDAQPNATQYLEDLILNKQDSDLSELFNKQTQELKLFIKSQSGGTSNAGVCICPNEINEYTGKEERSMTNLDCPVHGDLTSLEDLL